MMLRKQNFCNSAAVYVLQRKALKPGNTMTHLALMLALYALVSFRKCAALRWLTLICSVYKRRDLPADRVFCTNLEASALTGWTA